MIFDVTNVSEFDAALHVVRAGDIIALHPGTYSGLEIENLKVQGVISIVSSDPSAKATIAGLEIRGSQGISFHNLEFAVQPDGIENQFSVYDSVGISFDGLTVHGDMDGNPGNDQSGLMIRGSSEVEVLNSEFIELGFGLTLLESNSVVVSGNSFHDIRSDGVRGAGVSDVHVSKNYFTDFYPDADDHPDAIQFWEGEANPTNLDMVIDGNVIVRGDGGLMQGIFLRGPAGTFENVLISNNLVAGGMTNGIFIGGAEGASISDNRVLGTDGDTSWIRVEDSSQIALNNNCATKYIFGKELSEIIDEGNSTVGYISLKSLKELGDWIEGSHSSPMPTIALEGGGSVSSPATPVEPLGPSETEAPAAIEVTIIGTRGADNMFARGDVNARLEAGDGDDRLTGGEGQNTLVGGAGDDRYFVSDIDDAIIEAGGAGKDTVFASANHTLENNVEDLQLSTGATVGTGNSLANVITGAAQDDQLFGLGGADRLLGAEGRDVLSGGDGNDTLSGGAGVDRLFGGAGTDIFTFGPNDLGGGSILEVDRIEDFSVAAGERIHLSTVDANLLTAVDDRFAFIGTMGFHGKAGELRYEVTGGDTYVLGDLNGDRVADLKIQLVGTIALHSEDFVL
ncbi:MAG TPA: right-handed parallel beta-helix repeat-containing protein [Phenylobacterium sp.]|uniref:calcium-binding protein n=1 Tax=Phenylobacterium sp. TaxID=1871053 RepID=UPI002F94F594